MFAFLFAISSLYIFGLGAAVATLFQPRAFFAPTDVAQSLRALGLLAAWGLVANYAIILSSPTLTTSVGIGGAIATAAVCANAKALWRLSQRAFSNRSLNLALAVVVLGVLVQTFMYSLREWDARSDWFFHAKFFFYNQSPLDPAGWTTPAYGFSHPDYPELIPSLAGQVAAVAGYWNEYVPKISIWLATIPILLVLFSYFEKRWSFLFLILFQFIIVAKFIDNGVMDGLLALYTSIAILSLVTASDSKQSRLIALTFMTITIGLKNEGQLLCLSVLAAAAIVALRSKSRFKLPAREFLRYALLLAALLAPHLIWMIHAKHMNLENDIRLGAASLPFIKDRLTQLYPVWRIFAFMFLRSQLIYWVALLWLLRWAEKKFNRLRARTDLAFLFFAIYAAGLFAIYLATPHELEWHLVTSTYRTTLPLLLAMTGAAYIRLRNIEQAHGG